jgi:RNA polymerase sigma-70 factor (ECF subfamily)
LVENGFCDARVGRDAVLGTLSVTQNGPKFEAELERAFSERRTGLHAIARRAGREDAEDVVQDAFLKVVETSRREEVRTLDNFLARIVRCVAIDRVRRRASWARVSPELQERQVSQNQAPDPERVLMSAERLEQVFAIIADMPPRRRQVFLHHRIDELTYQQIAAKLGVSMKAVEKHMHLAMKQLMRDGL